MWALDMPAAPDDAARSEAEADASAAAACASAAAGAATADGAVAGRDAHAAAADGAVAAATEDSDDGDGDGDSDDRVAPAPAPAPTRRSARAPVPTDKFLPSPGKAERDDYPSDDDQIVPSPASDGEPRGRGRGRGHGARGRGGGRGGGRQGRGEAPPKLPRGAKPTMPQDGALAEGAERKRKAVSQWHPQAGGRQKRAHRRGDRVCIRVHTRAQIDLLTSFLGFGWNISLLRGTMRGAVQEGMNEVAPAADDPINAILSVDEQDLDVRSGGVGLEFDFASNLPFPSLTVRLWWRRLNGRAAARVAIAKSGIRYGVLP